MTRKSAVFLYFPARDRNHAFVHAAVPNVVLRYISFIQVMVATMDRGARV